MSVWLEKIHHFWLNPNERTRKINRNIVYSTIIRGAGILISLILVPLTLGYLNAYEYGIWITLNSILTWINFFDIGLGNGLRNKLTEAIAHKDFNLGKIYVSSTFFLLVIIAAVMCVLALIANCFINWNTVLNVDETVNNLNLVVGITIISLCINFVIKTIGTIYLSYQETWMNGLLTCLGAFLSLIWILILKYTTAPSLLLVAFAYSFAPVIVYLVAYPYTFFKRYPEIKPSFKSIKKRYFGELGGLGIKFFFLQIACLILFSTSNFIVSKLFTPTEVTPYNICFKYFNLIAMAFAIISAPFWSAITDAYAIRDINWIRINMNKMMRVCLILAIVCLFMIFISQPIFVWWVGKDVEIPYSLCLSIAVYTIIHLWVTLFCCYSNGTGKLRGQLLSMLLASCCYIPLAFILGEAVGVIGVSYAMALVLVIPAIWLTVEYFYSIKSLRKSL